MENEINLQISNLCDDGEFLWFTAYSFGILYKMNKVDMKPIFVTCFEVENMSEIRLYSDIVLWNDYLILTPLRAKNIVVFNKITEEKTYIQIDVPNNDYINGYSGWNYYSAQLFEHYIYFFPHQRTAVLQLNLLDFSMKIVNQFVNDVLNVYDLQYPRLYSKTRLVGSKLYAPISGGNKLQIIDLYDHTSSLIDLKDKKATYSDAFVYRDCVYLSPLEGTGIAYVNTQTGQQSIIPIKQADKPYIHYLGIMKSGNQLMFIPEYHGNITLLDTDANTISDTNDNYIESILDNYDDVFKYESKYMTFIEGESESYLYSNAKGLLIKIENENIKCFTIRTEIREEIKRLILKSKIESDNIIQESYIYTIDSFLDILTDIK